MFWFNRRNSVFTKIWSNVSSSLKVFESLPNETYAYTVFSIFYFIILNISNSFPDDHSDYGSTVSGSTGKSPGPIFPAPSFTFPGQPPPGTVLTHKAAVYYHHQLSLQEDQGIDMTQVRHTSLTQFFIPFYIY